MHLLYRWLFVAIGLGIIVFEECLRHAMIVLNYLTPISIRERSKRTKAYKPYQANVRYDGSTTEIVRLHGYPIEEHLVTTKDGFVLMIHRIPHGQTGIQDPTPRPPVLLMHGFLMSSEVWVTKTPSSSLAFLLADAGFDVYLLNARGSKYSCKHEKYIPNDLKFWRWSMDEIARFDIPCAIDYVIHQTGFEKVAYIGFSQGTAIGFAALSSNEEIASKVSLFVCLAPVAKLLPLNTKIASSIAMSPSFLTALFGQKKFLEATLFWRSLMTRTQFANIIKLCLRIIFGWNSENMTLEERKYCFAHLYSQSSVRSVVHWFQISRSNRFSMFDDGIHFDVRRRLSYPIYSTPEYPLHNIHTPIACFSGGKDTLPDTQWLLNQLNSIVYSKSVDHFEHLDLLWATQAPKLVFSKVIALLHEYSPQ